MAHRSCSKFGWLLLGSWLLVSPKLVLADIIDDINQLDPKKEKPNQTKPSEKKIGPTESNQESEEPLKAVGPELKPTSKSAGSDKPKDKKAAEKPRRDAPIHLASDGTSTYSRNGSVVRLNKNVVITQDDIRLQSDEAKVLFLNTGKKDGNSTVQTVEVNGKVNLSRFAKDPADRVTAKSDKAIFENDTQKVTLDGNARLWKDGHLIRGDRIVYEIITGMIKVDRAQGVVQPEKTSK